MKLSRQTSTSHTAARAHPSARGSEPPDKTPVLESRTIICARPYIVLAVSLTKGPTVWPRAVRALDIAVPSSSSNPPSKRPPYPYSSCTLLDSSSASLWLSPVPTQSSNNRKYSSALKTPYQSDTTAEHQQLLEATIHSRSNCAQFENVPSAA
jgi:hypothetical protein